MNQKWALTLDDLSVIISHYRAPTSHDDHLFLTILLTGFFALMRLGELTFPNNTALCDWCKVTKCASVQLFNDCYTFFLPAHKADRFFEGNRIIIMRNQLQHDPLLHFTSYIQSRNSLFPLTSPLWLTEKGHIPTRSFFISRIRQFFPNDVAGQSM